jgi:hypothetical protein
LRTAKAIEQFGVEAVTGRSVLTYREITGMKVAGLIVRLYKERERSESWAEWANKHPDEAGLLEAAHKIWQRTQ